MNRIRSSKKNIYKYLFFLLLILNLSVYVYLAIKHPRFHVFFQRQIENIFESQNPPIGDYLKGIDVSEYQGIINWKTIKNNQKNDSLSFIVLRGTAGRNHRDRFYKSNYREAKKIGVPVGVYHYYRPNESSEEQANYFIQNIKLSAGDLPPILDIEKISDVQSMSKLKKGVKNWLEIIEQHYGVKPILYTYTYFYNTYLVDDFNDYKLWIANYSNFKTPISNEKWCFWQYSEKGRVSGIKGPVDLDVFKGSHEDLKLLLLK